MKKIVIDKLRVFEKCILNFGWRSYETCPT